MARLDHNNAANKLNVVQKMDLFLKRLKTSEKVKMIVNSIFFPLFSKIFTQLFDYGLQLEIMW